MTRRIGAPFTVEILHHLSHQGRFLKFFVNKPREKPCVFIIILFLRSESRGSAQGCENLEAGMLGAVSEAACRRSLLLSKKRHSKETIGQLLKARKPE